MESNNTPIKAQDTNLLEQIGMSAKEAEIYEILLKLGKVPASKLLPETKLKRTTVYSVLDELIAKGLVEKDENDPIIKFRAKHPYALKEYLNDQIFKIKSSEGVLDSLLPNLINVLNLTQDQPGIRYLEGIEGFKKIYQDILKTNNNLRIFTSDSDRTNPEMEKVIDNNITKQKKLGIKTKAIVAGEEGHTKKSLARALEMNIELRIINDARFALPSQILIYGNKVAISSLKNEVITTLIENENIVRSFKNIFDYIWDSSEKEHQKNYDKLPDDLPAKKESKELANSEKRSGSA